jgi:hypothetical protein
MCTPIPDEPLNPTVGGIFPSWAPVIVFHLFYYPWIIFVVWPHSLFCVILIVGTGGIAIFATDHPTATNFTHDQYGADLMLIVWTLVFIISLWKRKKHWTLISFIGLVTVVVFCQLLPYLYVEHPEHARPFDTMLNLLCSEQLKYPAEFMSSRMCHTWKEICENSPDK